MADYTKGDRAFFEYHCNRAHNSAHASHWYRSHQWVEVMAVADEGSGNSAKERGQNGHPKVFTVRFPDGFQHDVFEHELLSSPHEADPSQGPPPFASFNMKEAANG